MGTARHIRFPSDMEVEIEKGIDLDRRRDFTDEVVYLVGLGLEEAEIRREAIARDLSSRRGNSAPAGSTPVSAEEFPVVGRRRRPVGEGTEQLPNVAEQGPQYGASQNGKVVARRKRPVSSDSAKKAEKPSRRA